MQGTKKKSASYVLSHLIIKMKWENAGKYCVQCLAQSKHSTISSRYYYCTINKNNTARKKLMFPFQVRKQSSRRWNDIPVVFLRAQTRIMTCVLDDQPVLSTSELWCPPQSFTAQPVRWALSSPSFQFQFNFQSTAWKHLKIIIFYLSITWFLAHSFFLKVWMRLEEF